MHKIIIIAGIALLAGCQALNQSTDRLADAVNAYCDNTAPEVRAMTRREINARLESRGRSIVVECGR
jgi:uncharacterized lipoprotein YajG